MRNPAFLQNTNAVGETGPAIRTQIDGLNTEYSYETGLDCSEQPDVTRQEFKDETDVNKVLARYGVEGLNRQAVYSAVDYDVDLQQSLGAIREAERAITRLPDEIRKKYGTWERLLDGAFNGEFKKDLTQYEKDRAAKEATAKEALDKANAPA